MSTAGWMACLALAGCAEERGSASTFEGDDEPQIELEDVDSVDVRLQGAVVRGWDHQRKLWDDDRSVDIEEVAELAEILGAPEAYVRVSEMVAEWGLDNWAPPDPFGTVEVFDGVSWHEPMMWSTPDTNRDNTLAPRLGITIADVSLEGDPRIILELIDEDDFLTGEDDFIGTVVLDADHLREALLDGGNVAVPVHSQGAGAVLFVEVLVVPSKS